MSRWTGVFILALFAQAAVGQVFTSVDFYRPSIQAQPPAEPPAEMQLQPAAQPPTIDGVLDDACWQAAEPFTPFVVFHTPTLAEEQRQVRMAFDAKHLYVAVRLQKQAGYALRDHIKVDGDDKMWEDDEIELFLDPGLNYDTYYQVIINAAGRYCDFRHVKYWVPDPAAADPRVVKQVKDLHRGWHSGVRYAVRTGDADATQWFIELALPVESMGLPEVPLGSRWGVNISSNNPRTEQFTNWIPGDWHDPYAYGQIIMGEPRLRVRQPNWGAFRPGANLFHAICENLAQQTQTYTMSIAGQTQQTMRFSLDAGQTATQGCTYPIAIGSTSADIITQVRDESGQLLYQTQLTDDMPPALLVRLAPYGYLAGSGAITGSLAVELGDLTLAQSALDAEIVRDGQVIRSQRVAVENAAARLQLDLGSFTPGRYTLRLTLRAHDDAVLAETSADFAVSASPYAMKETQ
jgi:hypothetical protein